MKVNINTKFTDTETKILEQFKNTLPSLAIFFGKGYEYVIHSLEDIENSVIAIENGYHSSRSLGAPITDFALQILSKIKEEGTYNPEVYYNKTANGALLQSVTIPILGETDNVIGLLCMNFYMDTPFIDVLAHFNLLPENQAIVKETFSSNQEDLLSVVVANAITEIESDPTVTKSQKNKEIILKLHQKGIFDAKNSVNFVSEKLGISKNTVYLHLRDLTN